jgi:hypothetical protein
MPKPPKKVSKAVGSLSASELSRLCNTSLARIYAQLGQGRTAFEIIAASQRRREQEAAKAVRVLPIDLDLAGPPRVNGAAAVPAYGESLARKEATLAELRGVELAERRKDLLPVAYFRLWATRFLVQGRDDLLKGPSELADALAAESDPIKCAVVVERWVERVMEKFYQLEKLWGPPLDDAA